MIWWRRFLGLRVSGTAPRMLSLAGAGLGLILAGGECPVRAAFEIRPSAALPSPLLPSCLPAALASTPAWSPSGEGAWSVAALHLALEPAAALALDAVGLRMDRRRWAGRAGVTRLGLPGYAEWEADIGAGSTHGLAFDVSLFGTQPSDLLMSEAGIEPRRAASLGASCVRSLGQRMSAAVWLRDFAGTGDHRALGIEPRTGFRLEGSPGARWTVSLLREWGAGARPEMRLALAWQPVPAWRLEHAVGPGRGGESTSLQAELGGLDLLAWSGRLAAGIPSMPGFAVGCQTKARASDTSGAQPDHEPTVVTALPALRLPAPTSWQDWERVPGEDLLIIDGAAVPAGFDADSLGAWVDSLEDGASEYREGDDAEPGAADQTSSQANPVDQAGPTDVADLGDPAGPADPAGPVGPARPAAPGTLATLAGPVLPGAPPGSVHPLRLVPWSRLGVDDIPAVDGIDAAARERFLAAVRSDGPRALADAMATAPDPVVRRLLVETAPYASAHAPPPSFRGIGPMKRPAVRWSREARRSGGGPVRASDRWEAHAASAGFGMHAAGRRPAGTDLPDGSWTALLEAQGVRLVFGRGSPPLTWGTGLWLRSRTIEVRTAGAAGGVRSDAAGDAEPAPMQSPRSRTETSIRGSALAPSSSGTDRVVAAEALLGSGATRLVAMESGDRTWIACERQGAKWNAGLLAGVGRAPTRWGLLASTTGPGGTHQAEVGVEERGPVRFALQSAGATARAGWGRAWWDIEGRTLIPRAERPTNLVTDEDRVSPDRRLRLRGAVVVGSIQTTAAFQVWEDGVGPTVIEAYRTGRSIQLRTVVRPRPGASLTLRATSSDGRSVRENDGERHTRTTQRLRLHATAQRTGPAERRRAAADWFLDAGFDERASRTVPSTTTARSVRDGHWLGLAVQVRVTGKGEASVGALDVCPPTSGTLLVAPGWSGGTGFSTGRGGLWGSGRLRWRLAWLRLEGKGSWPLLPSPDRTHEAHPAWVFTCGVEA